MDDNRTGDRTADGDVGTGILRLGDRLLSFEALARDDRVGVANNTASPKTFFINATLETERGGTTLCVAIRMELPDLNNCPTGGDEEITIDKLQTADGALRSELLATKSEAGIPDGTVRDDPNGVGVISIHDELAVWANAQVGQIVLVVVTQFPINGFTDDATTGEIETNECPGRGRDNNLVNNRVELDNAASSAVVTRQS